MVPGSAVTTSTVVFNDTKLSRHESLAQKLGSVSMANLGKEDQVRDKARFFYYLEIKKLILRFFKDFSKNLRKTLKVSEFDKYSKIKVAG